MGLTSAEPGKWLAPQQSDDLSGHLHRQLIGYIGLLLPGILILLVVLRDGVQQWQKLTSVSAYYYTGAVAAFVGMLIALSLFLFTYRGYRNKGGSADRTVSNVAAIAALGVALFPTRVPAGFAGLAWWQEWTGYVHYASAAVLFIMFAVFALWLFRITPRDGSVTRDKRWRNRVYLICGLVIVVSIAWAGVAAFQDRSIFLPESLALIAFSTSWLVKGYALTTLSRIAQDVRARLTRR